MAATALFALTVSAPARADTVTDWNAIATTAIVTTAAQSPQASTLSFAMVQGAVYDAVNAIDRGHRPYLVAPPAKRSDSKEAAAADRGVPRARGAVPVPAAHAAAALRRLAGRRPRRASRARRDRRRRRRRRRDARRTRQRRPQRPVHLPIGAEPGAWRPTPPTFALDPAPWVGNVRPFLVPERGDDPLRPPEPAHQHRLRGGLQRGQAARLAHEHDPHRRSDRGRDLLARPRARAVEPRLRSALGKSRARHRRQRPPVRDENLASADGAIGCWNSKYYWNFWRPITAIREAESDGNPATEADPAWTPLFDPATPQFGTPLVTPGFPDHPAGHGCISGAIVRTLQRFFGTDKIAFSAFSNRTRTTRSYDRFSQALKEIIDARVWGGIHFRTADVQGAALGKKVAHWLAEALLPAVR